MSLETLSETPTSTADPPQNENPLPQPSKRSIRLARRREWKARFDPVVPPSGPPLPQYVPMPELQLACPLSYNTEIQSFIDHPTFAATEVNYPRIEAIRCLLEDLVLRCVPSATGVALFGSACSTVMTPNSDLDFSIVLKTPTDSPSEILRLVRDEMRKGGPFTQDDYIPSARKPVTKCHIFHQVWNADQVDATAQDAPILFDIAVDHYLGVMNSQLIRTYCECDPRVRPFLLLIKKWTKAYNVADASMSRLASYSWSLTGLCFLQMVEPPIVPNLQSETYITASDQSLVEDHEYEDGIVRFSKDTAPWHSRQPNLLPNPSDPLQTTSPRPHNPSSVASLFVSYIDYMCHHYTNLHCMSVKHGGLVVTESIKHLLEETERPPRFVILDPFQKKRNPGVSVGRTTTTINDIGSLIGEGLNTKGSQSNEIHLLSIAEGTYIGDNIKITHRSLELSGERSHRRNTSGTRIIGCCESFRKASEDRGSMQAVDSSMFSLANSTLSMKWIDFSLIDNSAEARQQMNGAGSQRLAIVFHSTLTISDSRIELSPSTSAILISSSTFEKSGTESSAVIENSWIWNDVGEMRGIVETSAFPDIGGSVSVSIVGCSFNSQTILGKDGIGLSLARTPRKSEEDIGRISSSLISCSFVNISSIGSSHAPYLPHLNQKMLGCVVSLTSSHLSGSTIRDVNNGGSVLCSNSSFSSLLSSSNTSPPPAIVLPDGSPEQFVDGTVYSFDYNSGDSTTLASFTNCDFTGTLYSLADRPLTFKQYRGNIFIFSCSFTNTSVGDYKGGAVFIAKSLNYNTNPVTVEFCNFTDCTSYSSGAGMNMEDIAFVTVTKCRYVRCSNYRESSDSSGGGLWIYFSTSSSQSSTVSDLYFEECTTAQTAGGLYLSFVRNIHVIASLSFKGCSAISPIYRGSAGAMYIEGVSLAKHDISASHLKFEDCSAYREAGGLKSHLEESSLFLTDCEFVRCSSADSEMYKVLGGGGLYAYGYGAKITLKGCRFNECSSTTLGGAVFVEVSGLEMSDCLVQNCSSKTSGAVCIVPRSAVPITLTNTLFIENAVSDTPTYFNRHESMKDAVQFADFLIEDLEESYPTDVTIRDCWTTTTPNSVGMYSARYDPETFEQLSYERVVMDAFLGMGPLLTQKVEAFLDIESLRIDLVVKGKVPLESQEYEVTVAENEGGAEMTGHLKLSGGTGTLVLPSKDTLKFNTGYTITKIVAVVDPSSSSLMTNDITIPQEAWAFNLDANPSFATFTTPKIPPILKASCRAGSGTDHVWIQLTGLNITAGTYSVTLEGLEFSFPVRFTDGSDVISQVLSSEASIRLFGDGSKLTFGTEYTLKSVTDTSTSTPLDLCGLIITFTTPQATDRIVGIGTMGFTNSQKDEVSVSLSGSDLVSTEYFIETSPPSVLNGNKLSVTFTDQSGTLVGKVYSAFGNAVPLKFGETYEIVSVTRTNNQPILFVALTFSVPNEPARIESTSCTLNGPKTAVIVTLNGRQLLSAAMSVKLKNSTTNRFFMSNLLFVNTTSCTVSFPTAQTETNSALVFGGTYNVVSVESSDGKSSFVVNTGVNVSVPSAPIITSISSSLSPNCSHFEISFSGTSLPSTGSFVASISPSITLALRYVNGLWTTGWLTDGYVGMKLNTSYTVTQVADGENEMILNKDTFTTALGPTLSSIPIVTLKTGDLNSVVLSLDGLRMPVSSVVPSFDLIVVESGKTTEDISIPVSFSTNEVGSGEVEVYKSGKLKYSTSYSVVRMTSTAVSVSIPSAVIFSTPAAPTRIISAECNLDSETEKSAEIVLTGVSFPQSTPGSS